MSSLQLFAKVVRIIIVQNNLLYLGNKIFLTQNLIEIANISIGHTNPQTFSDSSSTEVEKKLFY